MHSARVVVLIVAVACACEFCHVLGVPTKNRSHNIFAILKAGNGLANQQKDNYQSPNTILYTSPSGKNHALPSKRSDDIDNEEDVVEDPRKPESLVKPEEINQDDELDLGRSFGYIMKREGHIEAEDVENQMRTVMRPMNFLRRTRSSSARPYDVPIIECPPADDQMERFPCPRPDRKGRYRCIDDHVLCDGFIDCPDGMDEDRQQCMFYKTTKAHLDVIADAIIRFIRGRK